MLKIMKKEINELLETIRHKTLKVNSITKNRFGKIIGFTPTE